MRSPFSFALSYYDGTNRNRNSAAAHQSYVIAARDIAYERLAAQFPKIYNNRVSVVGLESLRKCLCAVGTAVSICLC